MNKRKKNYNRRHCKLRKESKLKPSDRRETEMRHQVVVVMVGWYGGSGGSDGGGGGCGGCGDCGDGGGDNRNGIRGKKTRYENKTT